MDRADAVAAALTWAKKAGSTLYGVKSEKVEGGRGWGMVCCPQKLEAGTVIAGISADVLLTKPDAEVYLSSALSSAVQTALSLDHEADQLIFVQVIMVVCAVLKARLDPEAPWEPLLAAFPATVESTLLWNEAELALLQWPESIREVNAMTMWLRRVFLHLSPALDKEVDSLKAGETVNYEQFSQQFCVVYSRGMDLSDDDQAEGFFIPPVADMFNYVPGACTAQLTRAPDTGAVLVSMQHDVEVGEEVCVDYGARRSNANILLVYGFVGRPNPLETLELEVPSHVRLADRLALVAPFGEQGATFKVARGGVDLRVKRALRIASSSPEFVEAGLRQHLANGQHEDSFLLETTNDQELERRVLEALLATCEAALARHSLPGSLAGSPGQGGVSATRRVLAQEFIAERAELLQHLVTKLAAQMPRARDAMRL